MKILIAWQIFIHMSVRGIYEIRNVERIKDIKMLLGLLSEQNNLCIFLASAFNTRIITFQTEKSNTIRVPFFQRRGFCKCLRRTPQMLVLTRLVSRNLGKACRGETSRGPTWETLVNPRQDDLTPACYGTSLVITRVFETDISRTFTRARAGV